MEKDLEQQRLKEEERITHRLDQMNATMTLYIGPSILSNEAAERTWQHLDCWCGDEGMEMMMRVLEGKSTERWPNLVALVRWRGAEVMEGIPEWATVRMRKRTGEGLMG
jgi:hypothetical protein